MTITSQPIPPKYQRDNGLYVLDLASVELPSDFVPTESDAVYLPARQIAGNHRHPRREAYLCCDEGAELHWQDDAGQVHAEPMVVPGGEPRLFVLPPMIPHAVVNGSDHGITLLGWADGPLEDIEPMDVAKPFSA